MDAISLEMGSGSSEVWMWDMSSEPPECDRYSTGFESSIGAWCGGVGGLGHGVGIECDGVIGSGDGVESSTGV